MSELLVGEDLEKDYRTGPEVVRVLRGASVAVGSGEVVALVGASGVGKSTLLHVLGALDRPTAGRVLFEGEDVFGRGEAGLVRYRRHQIGFVFQFYNLLGEMTALENTMIPALLARRAVREARDLAAEALAERSEEHTSELQPHRYLVCPLVVHPFEHHLVPTVRSSDLGRGRLRPGRSGARPLPTSSDRLRLPVLQSARRDDGAREHDDPGAPRAPCRPRGTRPGGGGVGRGRSRRPLASPARRTIGR